MLQDVEAVYLGYYEVAIADWTAEERAAARAVLARLRESLTRLEFDEQGRATGAARPGSAERLSGGSAPTSASTQQHPPHEEQHTWDSSTARSR